MFDWQNLGVTLIKFDYRTHLKSIERLEFDYRFFDWFRSLNVEQRKKLISTNAEKDRANSGHSSKPSLPSFSLYNKVLLSITRVSMGLTDRRKTAQNLVDSRKN